MKFRSITLLVISQVAGLSLWFVSSAVLSDIMLEQPLSDVVAALLSSSVSIGFVAGALCSASTGLADRFDPRRLFSLCVLLASLCNLATLVIPPDHPMTVMMRVLTGFFLAGVYPVGMKIAAGWGTHDRGLLVGLLVGGLTLGSALPHLLAFIGGADWRATTISASLVAVCACVLILFTKLGPDHASAPRFQTDALHLAWSDKRIRYAFAGYLGHMWELYAMWAWISVAVAASYAVQTDPATAAQLAKLTAFIAIGAGALSCPVAGLYADRLGKANVTMFAMAVSASAAMLSAVFFGGPMWLFFAIVVLWGASIIADSAQFSALVADAAPADKAGSLMTLQTALGFTLTVFTVQLTPVVVAKTGWPFLFVVLAIGPVLGILAMRKQLAAARVIESG